MGSHTHFVLSTRPNVNKFTPLWIGHGRDMRGHRDLISRDAIEVGFLQPVACLPYPRQQYILASFLCWWVSLVSAQP
jgi:hypothetical protein